MEMDAEKQLENEKSRKTEKHVVKEFTSIRGLVG